MAIEVIRLIQSGSDLAWLVLLRRRAQENLDPLLDRCLLFRFKRLRLDGRANPP